jgi:hypothetical protein
MSRRDLSVKGGTSERCYRTRRGRTDEQRYAIISPYFDGRIKMNGPYPEITNISFLAKLFFKTFISLKHLSDYRTVGLSDYSYGPFIARGVLGDFFVYGIYNKTFSKPLCLMYCFLSRCCYIDLVDILFVLSVYDIIV